MFYSHCFVLSAPLVHDEGDEGSRRTPSGDEREAGGDAVGQGEVPARHRHGTAAAGSLVGVVEREVATDRRPVVEAALARIASAAAACVRGAEACVLATRQHKLQCDLDAVEEGVRAAKAALGQLGSLCGGEAAREQLALLRQWFAPALTEGLQATLHAAGAAGEEAERSTRWLAAARKSVLDAEALVAEAGATLHPKAGGAQRAAPGAGHPAAAREPG